MLLKSKEILEDRLCKLESIDLCSPGARMTLVARAFAVVLRNGHEDAFAADHLAVDLPAVHLAHCALRVGRLGEFDVRVAFGELGVHRVRGQLDSEHAAEVGEDLMQVLFPHVPRQLVDVHLQHKAIQSSTRFDSHIEIETSN